MKVIDNLQNAKETLFSFELLPPLKGKNINAIFQSIEPLMEFNPSNINVTYHQEEVVYKKHKSGLLEKKSVRKRPGTVAISAAIKNKYPSVEVVPHLICGGFTKEETEYALIDFHFLGINNILVLRGDPLKSQRVFKAEKNGHSHTDSLIRQIIDMNKGKYLDEELENSAATDYSVGVAGYPEKHFEAPNMKSDLKYLKQKIDAGAEYIITQMFFDNKKYFDFVKSCREVGINVPIIPGIKPISRINDLSLLPQTFYIDIPEELENELNKCKNDNDAFHVGVEWGIHQSKELKKNNVPALHYFTIGISESVRQIAKNVF